MDYKAVVTRQEKFRTELKLLKFSSLLAPAPNHIGFSSQIPERLPFGDKDSLLDQTLTRLLNLLLGLSGHFIVKSSFSKNPAESF